MYIVIECPRPWREVVQPEFIRAELIVEVDRIQRIEGFGRLGVFFLQSDCAEDELVQLLSLGNVGHWEEGEADLISWKRGRCSERLEDDWVKKNWAQTCHYHSETRSEVPLLCRI